MTCCEPTIIPFTLASSTIIPWGPFEISEYGPQPNVQVYYKEGSEYVLSDDMNAVVFDGSVISVDHGGIMSGMVKIF